MHIFVPRDIARTMMQASKAEASALHSAIEALRLDIVHDTRASQAQQRALAAEQAAHGAQEQCNQLRAQCEQLRAQLAEERALRRTMHARSRPQSACAAPDTAWPMFNKTWRLPSSPWMPAWQPAVRADLGLAAHEQPRGQDLASSAHECSFAVTNGALSTQLAHRQGCPHACSSAESWRDGSQQWGSSAERMARVQHRLQRMGGHGPAVPDPRTAAARAAAEVDDASSGTPSLAPGAAAHLERVSRCAVRDPMPVMIMVQYGW